MDDIENTIKDAIQEQEALREKLSKLEEMNTPAQFMNPFLVNQFESDFSEFDTMEPERLSFELSNAESLLANVIMQGKDVEKEIRKMMDEINEFTVRCNEETQSLVVESIQKNRNRLIAVQDVHSAEEKAWSLRKTELISKMQSTTEKTQRLLNQSAVERNVVEEQRKEIKNMAAVLRNALQKNKELSKEIEDGRERISLMEILESEIGSNKMRIDELREDIQDQYTLLSAEKISDQASNYISQLEREEIEAQETTESTRQKLEQAIADNRSLIGIMNEKKKIMDEKQSEYNSLLMEAQKLEAEVENLRETSISMAAKAHESNDAYMTRLRSKRAQEVHRIEDFVLNHYH